MILFVIVKVNLVNSVDYQHDSVFPRFNVALPADFSLYLIPKRAIAGPNQLSLSFPSTIRVLTLPSRNSATSDRHPDRSSRNSAPPDRRPDRSSRNSATPDRRPDRSSRNSATPDRRPDRSSRNSATPDRRPKSSSRNISNCFLSLPLV